MAFDLDRAKSSNFTVNMSIDEHKEISSMVALLIIPCNLSNIMVLIMKGMIHKNIHILIANLSVGDSLLCITLAVSTLLQAGKRSALPMAGLFYAASVFTSLAITMDRYLKVRYGLRYHQIVTKKRVAIFVVLLWTLSVVVSLLPAKLSQEPSHSALSVRSVSIMCSAVMISVSIWVRRVRNRIATEIEKRNEYFGVNGEKVSIMRRMRKAVREIMQLSFVTATLIIIGSTFVILHCTFKSGILGMISFHANLAYFLSNPFLYAIVMKDIRSFYATFFQRIVEAVRPRSLPTPKTELQLQPVERMES